MYVTVSLEFCYTLLTGAECPTPNPPEVWALINQIKIALLNKNTSDIVCNSITGVLLHPTHQCWMSHPQPTWSVSINKPN